MSLREVDSLLFFYVNRGLESPVFDLSMPFITNKYYLIVLCIAFWLLIKHKRNAIAPILLAIISVALSDWLSHVIKHVIERPRPCQVYTAARLLVGCTESFSMPSNHAANSFAMAMALSYKAGSRVRWMLISIALLVGFSRVYVGVHYPFDVAVGSFLGICVSLAVVNLYSMASKKYETMPYTTLFIVAILGISLFRIYYITSGVVDLSPDEAHYWEWSRRLDLSYYSKGPMIAYLIAFSTAIFGDNVFGIRIMAVVFSALSSIAVYFLGKELFDEKTGAVSAVLMQMIPLYSAYGVLFTIDSPFLFFWVLSLYLFYRAAEQQSSSQELKASGFPPFRFSAHVYWIFLGIAVGLGLLTKYTMAFFYVCALLFLLVSKQHRGIIYSKGPYISLILSLIVFSPVIFWNAKTGWLTFRHTAGQAHIADGFNLSVKNLAEFVGSQVGVITPVIFILLLYSLFRLRKERPGNFLFWFSVPVLFFFLGKSIQAKVQANWAMPAYAAGFIAFSAIFVSRWEELKKWLKITVIAGVVISIAATAFAYYSPKLSLPQKLNPASRILGWKELGNEVTGLAGELSKKGNYFIFSDRYQVSSELAFYVKGKPVTYCINLGRRMNQYDLWPGLDGKLHFNAIFVTIDDIQVPEMFVQGFDRCDKKIFTAYSRGERTRDYSIFTCYDLRGLKQKEITSY